MDAKAQDSPIAQPNQYYPSPETAQQYSYPTAPQHPQDLQQSVPARGCYRNSPQFFSIGAGAFVISTGGMSLSWGLGFDGWSTVAHTTYMNVCWFAAAIAGAFLSAILINTLQKKKHMLLSSALVMLGGVLFISLYDNFGAIMTARHINGFAVGWILVTTFVKAGEEAAAEVRGTLISTVEAVSFCLGIFIQILYSATWTKDINFYSNQMHGVLLLCFGCIAFATTLKLSIESPVYYLQKNQEQLALESLILLQRPCVMNAEKQAQLEEHKLYIATKLDNFRVFSGIFKFCILRGLIGLSFTAVVREALQFTAIGGFFYQQIKFDKTANLEEQAQQAKDGITISAWPLIVYGVCRFCGTLIGACLQDTLGRKMTLAISMLICGAMAIGIGLMFSDALYFLCFPGKMQMALASLFVLQFFAGVSATSSSSYLSEAFPVTAKPYCIAFVLSIEMKMFIICEIFEVTFYSISQYFYALGSLSFIFLIFKVILMPETKKNTLRVALKKFQNLFHTAFK